MVLRRHPRPEAPVLELDTAVAPPPPAEVGSVDELYWTGVHLQQYRHPTRSPLPYWEEALRRDPGEARSRIAIADAAYRRGEYAVAEGHLRVALERMTALNANPRDGEASYLLGLVLARTGRDGAAIDAFAKAAWDGRRVAPAAVEIARLAIRRGDLALALDKAESALTAAPTDSRAALIRASILRRLGRGEDADAQLDAVLDADPLDHAARVLRAGDTAAEVLDGRTLIDIARDLHAAGAPEIGLRLLAHAASAPGTAAGEVRPLAHYHRALLLDAASDTRAAADARAEARRAPDELCFPAGLDDHDALQAALRAEPADLRARELLAMLLFDRGRKAEALALWREVTAAPETCPRALRNAALAVHAVEGDAEAARSLYDRAIDVRPDGRLLYERDQLLARIAVPAQERLSLLEAHRDVVLRRDDATAEYAELLVQVGRWADAIETLSSRSFAPWEGGEGRVLGVWERANLARADACERAGDSPGAMAAVRAAVAVPASLGEDRHPLADTTVLFGRWAQLLQRNGHADEAVEVRRRIRTSTEVRPVHEDGSVDYFATSLPELLLFPRSGSVRN